MAVVLFMFDFPFIYLLSHSFLYKFGDVAEVRYWSIILENVSIKTSPFKKGCDICSLDEKVPSCSSQYLLWAVISRLTQ